jgi:hypothetical protein
VRQDAVVAVTPLDAERIASHLRELVDAERVGRSVRHALFVEEGARRGNPEAGSIG